MSSAWSTGGPGADPKLVTPEAVVIELPRAGLGSRLIAQVLDALVRGVAAIVIAVFAGVVDSGGGGGTVFTVVVFFLIFLVIVGYPIILETVWKGKTVGKMVMGLRVVTREGAPIGFRHAAVRGAVGLVENLVLFGAPAVISMLSTRDSVRLGDMAAGTIVIRERTGAPPPVAMVFPMPYGCEAYVATLDVSAVDGAAYQAVRSFLLRAPTLEPVARDSLAHQIANGISQRMHHTPPTGMPAGMFLACVAFAVQQRSQPAAPSWGVAPPRPPAGPYLPPSAPVAPAPAPAMPSPPPASAPPASPPSSTGGFAPPQ